MTNENLEAVQFWLLIFSFLMLLGALVTEWPGFVGLALAGVLASAVVSVIIWRNRDSD